MSTRYSTFTNSNSRSTSSSKSKSNTTSSTEHLHQTSQALIKSDKKASINTKSKTKPTSNITSMMKKLIETKSHRETSEAKKSYVPVDFIAEDLRKNGVNKVGGFGSIQKKLMKGFKGKKEGEGGSNGKERKALMDVKNTNGNTRSLAMVLKSERELLNANKEQEEQIVELRLLLEGKNREVEKLKDLCLKQREEIKYLKNSILFPDDNIMDSRIKELMEKKSSELNQAKQLIPSLQRQVSSLTGQLQCLAEDLAEVKADKIYHGKGSYEANVSSSTLLGYHMEEADNSLDFSTTPGSPDDLFHEDLNPCLTPYTAKIKSKEFKVYISTEDESLPSRYNMQMGDEVDNCSCYREVSKSSDCCHCAKATNGSYRAAYRSHESKYTGRKQMHF